MPAAREGPEASSTSPISSAMVSAEMPPGRRSCAGLVVMSMMVLSTPTPHGPPSRMRSNQGQVIANVIDDMLGGGGTAFPNLNVDGAAIAPPCSRSCWVSG